VKDPDGKLVYFWRGKIDEIKTISENVVYPYGKSTYEIQAFNKNGSVSKNVTGIIEPQVGVFELVKGTKSPRNTWYDVMKDEDITFKFSFSGAKLAYIRRGSGIKNVIVATIRNPSFFKNSGTVKVTKVGSGTGNYHLELIGIANTVRSKSIFLTVEPKYCRYRKIVGKF